MANPQLENGHLKIANEVWEHLMSAGLTGSELSLVMAVIRKTWGWKRMQQPISLSEFCALTNQPERTTAHSLESLISKKLLLQVKGGGRGNPSKWSFNKDWESWETLPTIAEKINSAKINTVLNGNNSLPTIAEIPAKNGRVYSCNVLETKEQLSPKESIKESKAIQESSTPVRDEAYDHFAELFERKTGSPYLKCKGDFPQLAALRKSFHIQPRETPPDWDKTCANYFDSPMGSYSLAWMVTGNRYAVLRKSKLNQYGKPDGGQNGSHQLSLTGNETPGSTSEQRNSRGEKLYIPKQV
jgi:phage replication O-like protein O